MRLSNQPRNVSGQLLLVYQWESCEWTTWTSGSLFVAQTKIFYDKIWLKSVSLLTSYQYFWSRSESIQVVVVMCDYEYQKVPVVRSSEATDTFLFIQFLWLVP